MLEPSERSGHASSNWLDGVECNGDAHFLLECGPERYCFCVAKWLGLSERLWDGVALNDAHFLLECGPERYCLCDTESYRNFHALSVLNAYE